MERVYMVVLEPLCGVELGETVSQAMKETGTTWNGSNTIQCPRLCLGSELNTDSDDSKFRRPIWTMWTMWNPASEPNPWAFR